MLCCTVLNTISRLQQGTDIKLWLLLTQIKVNIDLSASASSSTAVREHHFSIITETSSSYPHDTHSCTTPSMFACPLLQKASTAAPLPEHLLTSAVTGKCVH